MQIGLHATLRAGAKHDWQMVTRHGLHWKKLPTPSGKDDDNWGGRAASSSAALGGLSLGMLHPFRRDDLVTHDGCVQGCSDAPGRPRSRASSIAGKPYGEATFERPCGHGLSWRTLPIPPIIDDGN